MPYTNETIERFFADYTAGFNRAVEGTPDLEAIAAKFADCFVAASPQGVFCGENNDKLREVMDQGYANYRALGAKSVTLRSLDINAIDDLHAMVRVGWSMRFEQPGNEQDIDFEVIYLVQVLADQPRVFAWVSGDEQAVLRERGLLPESG